MQIEPVYGMQAVFTASDQNRSGVLYSPSIVLAMSISVCSSSLQHHFVVVCRERRTHADAFFLKILFYLKVLELRSIIASYLFHLSSNSF